MAHSLPLKCEVCCKIFSGPVPASQHFNSHEHRKKVATVKQEKKEFMCVICNVACNTWKILEQHNQSPRHLANATKKQHFEQFGNSSASDGSYYNEQNDVYKFSVVTNKGWCYICSVDLSSVSQAQSHLNGKAHKKKLVQMEAMKAPGFINNQQGRHMKKVTQINQDLGSKPTYSCTLCNVTFTGPENEETHMLSQKHLKNVKLMEKKKRGEDLPLSCNACGCHFNSQESAEAHFEGTKHRRNIENMKVQSRSCNDKLKHETSPKLSVSYFENEDGRGFMKSIERRHESEKTDVQRDRICTSSVSNDHLRNMYNVNQISDTSPVRGDDYNELLMHKQHLRGYSSERQSSEESLLLKPVEVNESSLIIKPFEDETSPHTQNRQTLNESLNIKLMNSNTTDEQKIKAETCSRRGSDDLNHGKFSSTDTEPVRFMVNDLDSSLGSVGLGRGIFRLLSQNDERLPGKVINFEQCHKDKVVEKIGFNGSETARKSLWESTRPVSDLKTPLNTIQHKESSRQEYALQSHSEGKLLDSTIPAMPDFEAVADRSQHSPQNCSVPCDEEEYVFDKCTGRGRCLVCGINFTSFEHMSQHIKGKKHLKAREVRKQMLAAEDVVNASLLCKICAVTFSGFEARDQHMASEKHKCKERQLLNGEQNEFFCDICKVSCSGRDNLKQHEMGAQHRKMSGMLPTDDSGMPAFNFDRTKWYLCEVCNCKLNTYEQLKIHEQSPRHLKQLEKQKTCGDMVAQDHTVWFPCHVCNCRLNSQEQLRVHEASPAHIAKLPNNQQESHSRPSNIQLSHVSEPKAQTDPVSPLESFLSEELFPKEFQPRSEPSDDQSKTSRLINDFETKLVMTDEPFYIPGHIPPGGNIQTVVDSRETSESTSGANRGQVSDLAWATRSRGNKENHCKQAPSSSSASEGYEMQGARPKQIGCSPTTNSINDTPSSITASDTIPLVNNPFAATHPYYCRACNAPMNTKKSYEKHLVGKRHMQKVCTEQAPQRNHHSSLRLSTDYLPFTRTSPRNYQEELYHKALEDDTLCFLPTGTGKTLVAVMTMSAMLEKHPSKNVLFLVDKVLLVLQQSKYIRDQVGNREYARFNPDSDTCMDTVNRTLHIAAVCMDQQTTHGTPLWKHDIVVVTAAFCKNLMDKQILRWEDFSLVVFDEAHHCEKGHPFNSLLTTYHRKLSDREKKPKILGLTASPAGKADVQKTLLMLQGLVANMGDVHMTIVEEHENVDALKEYQSNAAMIIRSEPDTNNLFEKKLRHELSAYIMHCVLKLFQISNINSYVDFDRDLSVDMNEEDIRCFADEFICKNFEAIQLSLNSIESKNKDGASKIEFSSFRMHVQAVLIALSCLEDLGALTALQEIEDMQASHNFEVARDFGMPTAYLQQMLSTKGKGIEELLSRDNSEDDGTDFHVKRLIDELADGETAQDDQDKRRISLVLVKQRRTAHLITRALQNSKRMKQLGLNTTYVVGHGGGGAPDKGMNVNQQKRVLEDIKQFKYQVIVATSVAEEGVDWPECERVISMYPPSTVTALVQMRGRARRKNSKFIVLCSSREEEGKLYDIMNREQNMIKATRILIEQKRNGER